MEKLAEKINLIVVSLLVTAALTFFLSIIRGDLAVALFGGIITLIGIGILKITLKESR